MPNGNKIIAAFRLVGIILLTLVLLPVQIVLHALRLPLRGKVPRLWHRCLRRLLGLEVQRFGRVHRAPPTLFVANHSSYLDIVVLGSLLKCSFIAKKEISGWPVFGFLAKLQSTVFVERTRQQAEAQRNLVAALLAEGRNLVLFPEGTCSDGNALLPFKSSLFGIADAFTPEQQQHIMVQPITLDYAKLDGIPLGRVYRPLVTWFGDMELASHVWGVVQLGRLGVEVTFHPPLSLAAATSRKELSKQCEATIALCLQSARQGKQKVEVRRRLLRRG
ncbi:MAG: lysophospholipid acyltransferase family protein [Holosporales bacterium]|jgi:1-acyl-sn-glycerol-3-phosphate acyltransferase